MSKIGLCTAIWAVLALVAASPEGRADVEVVSDDARLTIAETELPQAITRGQWSLLVWIYAPHAIDRPSTLLSVGGRVGVVALQDRLIVLAQQAGHSAVLEVDGPISAGRWHLLAFSMDFRAKRTDAWLATQGDGPVLGPVLGPVRHASSSLLRLGRQRAAPVIGSAAPVPPIPEIATDNAGLIIGQWDTTLPAARLVYGGLALRDHALLDQDVRALWASRDYYGPHGLETTDAGGRMTGWRGCPFLTFHSISPGPNGPAEAGDKASYVGIDNGMMVLQPTERVSARSGSFRLVGPVANVRGMIYRSRLEPGLQGFFEIEPPPFDAPSRPIGPLGDKASMLAEGPQGLVRVMVSANSRGVRGSSPPQPWPEGFAHGFVQELLHQTAGVMMRPATLLDSRGGWFGLDTSHTVPKTLLARPLHTRTDAWGDWTRFGSGTLPAVSRGPGAAINVSPSGVYRLRCGPVPGSLLVAEAPLMVRSTLLAFPGSSDLVWEPERGHLQDGPGQILGDAITVPLDTTRTTHTIEDDDQFLTDTEWSLPSTLDVRPDDAIVISRGAALGAVSTVRSIRVEGDRIIVGLSHPFGAEPQTGDELRIGPWRFHDVEHRFEPVPVGDDRTWRGLVLHAAGYDRLGIMVYGVSAWRPDVDGFVFGTAGQSGKGYAVQLAESFPGSLEAWTAQAQPDVWIQGLAQQGSAPSSMADYLDTLRAGVGDQLEVIWASDAVHARSDHEQWHGYVRENAADVGVAAIFAVGDPRIGSYFAQAASGMRTDEAHFSSFGSRIIARAWLDQLARLATGPCTIADYDGDGEVSVFDLIAFQADWEARDPRADLDGDGLFLIFDFLVLLTAIDNCT